MAKISIGIPLSSARASRPADPPPILGWSDKERGLYAYELLEYARLRPNERSFIDTAVLFHDRGWLSAKQQAWFDDIALRYESTITPSKDCDTI